MADPLSWLEIDTDGQADRYRNRRGQHEPADRIDTQTHGAASGARLMVAFAMAEARDGGGDGEEDKRRHQHLDGADIGVADRRKHRQGILAPNERHTDAGGKRNQRFQPKRDLAEQLEHGDYFRV